MQMTVVDRVNAAARRVPTWSLYIGGAAWVGWLFWLGLSGQLGAEPINRLEREYGALAIKLIIAGLLVTPLRRWTGVNLIRFRRAIGVTAFFVVMAHLLVWAVLDVQSLSRVWADIVKRPYVTIGMAAFVLLIPLAVTSNTLSVRRMGGALWRRVHLLTYPAAILGGVHYLWLVKGFQIEPILYMAVILGLLAVRLRWRTRAALA